MQKNNSCFITFLYLIIIFFSLNENIAYNKKCNKSKNSNKEGIEKFQQDIIFIYNNVRIKDTLTIKFDFDTIPIDKNRNFGFLPAVISKIEELTKIESKSEGNFLGKLDPQLEDIQNWIQWYNKNKYNIYWDSLKNNYYYIKTKKR